MLFSRYRRKRAQLRTYFRTQSLPRGLIATIEANFVARWTNVTCAHRFFLGGDNDGGDGRVMLGGGAAGVGVVGGGGAAAVCVDKEQQKAFMRELPIGLRADIAFEAKASACGAAAGAGADVGAGG